MSQNFTYTTKDEVASLVSQQQLIEALTDKGGRTPDEIFADIQKTVADDIHFRLESRCSVPFFGDLPFIVKRAALILTAEAIFGRRKIAPKDNPFYESAKKLRERLDLIGHGKAPIGGSLNEDSGSVEIISEVAKTVSSSGRLST